MQVAGVVPEAVKTRRLRLRAFFWVLALCGILLQPAQAAFVGEYALGNFTVTNSAFASGSVTTLDGGLSAILTGSDTGSGLAGYTDVTIAIAGTGLLSFHYSYFSDDLPTFDNAGYLLGSIFIELADASGQSGDVQIPVTAGQIFGFSVATDDNTFGPGILTISNFTAPGNSSAVPEPGTWGLMLLAGAAVAVSRWRVRREALQNAEHR